MSPFAVALLALALALPAAAQDFESAPLAPPRENGGTETGRQGPFLEGGQVPRNRADAPGAEAEESDGTTAAAPGAATEFKRAPFRAMGPKLPDPIPPVPTEARPGARLRLLDTLTAETRTLDLATGETARLEDRLAVRLEACAAPGDAATKGTRAFLEVADRLATGPNPVFRGWIFADSPALSAMDHPRYDLWLISCTISAPEIVSGNE